MIRVPEKSLSNSLINRLKKKDVYGDEYIGFNRGISTVEDLIYKELYYILFCDDELSDCSCNEKCDWSKLDHFDWDISYESIKNCETVEIDKSFYDGFEILPFINHLLWRVDKHLVLEF